MGTHIKGLTETSACGGERRDGSTLPSFTVLSISGERHDFVRFRNQRPFMMRHRHSPPDAQRRWLRFVGGARVLGPRPPPATWAVCRLRRRSPTNVWHFGRRQRLANVATTGEWSELGLLRRAFGSLVIDGGGGSVTASTVNELSGLTSAAETRMWSMS